MTYNKSLKFGPGARWKILTVKAKKHDLLLMKVGFKGLDPMNRGQRVRLFMGQDIVFEGPAHGTTEIQGMMRGGQPVVIPAGSTVDFFVESDVMIKGTCEVETGELVQEAVA